MQIFFVNTTVRKEDLPADLLSETTEELAKAVGKPAQLIAVHIHADQIMMIGGNVDPCALCSYHSIDKISCVKIKEYSKILCGLLNKHLGISPERICINFVEMDACHVAWNNTTLAEM
ncbi:macrophage migration inhibitory factor-like [Syngnathoides biaculeatus]|uniref:macrophage migration inhibitory factor-like n=1 Tax=Syngnathoides biaculeatus TaxID=300417 RepID=UPI002ADD9830|nr:macrophage migration inhibitory factor-like [Syngnathoides biaculeatus]